MKNALMLSGFMTALSSLPAMAQELEIIGKPVDGGMASSLRPQAWPMVFSGWTQ